MWLQAAAHAGGATGRALCAKTRELFVEQRGGVVRVKERPQRRVAGHPHEHQFARRDGGEGGELQRGPPARGCADQVLRVFRRVVVVAVVFRW